MPGRSGADAGRSRLLAASSLCRVAFSMSGRRCPFPSGRGADTPRSIGGGAWNPWSVCATIRGGAGGGAACGAGAAAGGGGGSAACVCAWPSAEPSSDAPPETSSPPPPPGASARRRSSTSCCWSESARAPASRRRRRWTRRPRRRRRRAGRRGRAHCCSAERPDGPAPTRSSGPTSTRKEKEGTSDVRGYKRRCGDHPTSRRRAWSRPPHVDAVRPRPRWPRRPRWPPLLVPPLPSRQSHTPQGVPKPRAQPT